MIVSKIQINHNTTALLEIDKGAVWFLEVKVGETIKKIAVNATTIMCLMTAERELKAYYTGFYEVGE